MKLILLAGMPATGKSTLARTMQKAFGFPILEKDDIKEQLFDTLGFTCYEEKRRLDVIANAILLSLLRSLRQSDTSAIVVNNFSSEAGENFSAFLSEGGVDTATVFLDGDPQILYERYYERDKNGRRHIGHAMQRHYPPIPEDPEVFDMSREGFDQRFLKLGMDRLCWEGPVLRLDATCPQTLDAEAVIDWLKTTLELS